MSFFSTSPVLSNRERFPYFLRTIPSDVNQAQAMVELVKMLKWTYVSVVYEESSYGIQVGRVVSIIPDQNLLFNHTYKKANNLKGSSHGTICSNNMLLATSYM